MRPLKPNRMGAFVPTKTQPQFNNSMTNAFTRPSRALSEIDRIRQGEPPKICVVRSGGGIGDVLMTTPTVRAISKKYGCKVDYATEFGYLDGALAKVLQGNPYIERVIPWNDIHTKHDEYNAVLNLTCPCAVHEKPLAPPINRIDLFARHAGVQLDSPKMDLILSPEELETARTYISMHGLDRYRLVLFQPSSSSTCRDAPPEKMKDALQKVLSNRKDTRGLIITHLSDKNKVDWRYSETHVLNNFDVRQLAAIMYFCDLVVCPDSSILHLASALSKKCLTLFGPTDPRARVNYHPEAVSIWPGKELRNYPCWYEDPKDGYLCWKRLDTEVIAGSIVSMLDNKPLPPSRDYVTFGQYTHDLEQCEIL